MINNICKKCKYWDLIDSYKIYGFCNNEIVQSKSIDRCILLEENFGCIFFEEK
jgi:hypothetical protein